MPRPRFNNLTEDRRRELLERAANEFAVHGYQGASLNSLITGIGLSKGAFYYYFDDKADLFDTVARFAFDDLIGGGVSSYDLEALNGESFWRQLEGWYVELMARLHERPWLAGLGKLLYDPPAVDGVDRMVASHFDQVRGWLADLLRHGRAVGAVREDVPLELLQQMLIGAMEGSDRWFVDHWEELSPARREQLASVVFRVARRMVATSLENNGSSSRAQGAQDG